MLSRRGTYMVQTGLFLSQFPSPVDFPAVRLSRNPLQPILGPTPLCNARRTQPLHRHYLSASKLQPLLRQSSHAIPQKARRARPPHRHLHKTSADQVREKPPQYARFRCRRLRNPRTRSRTSDTIVRDGRASWIARRPIASATNNQENFLFAIFHNIYLFYSPPNTRKPFSYLTYMIYGPLFLFPASIPLFVASQISFSSCAPPRSFSSPRVRYGLLPLDPTSTL
jgi:hypothetical protein